MGNLGATGSVLISKKSLFDVMSKKQQDDMVQLFGHFQWSLKCQSPDYNRSINVILNINFSLILDLNSHRISPNF